MYIAVLDDRHDLPVHSVLVLLRPQAWLSNLIGSYARRVPGEKKPYRTFRYQVIRVWEQPPEWLLAGGVGLLETVQTSDELLPATSSRKGRGRKSSS